MYTIKYSDKALKQLSKFEKEIRERITKGISRIKRNPRKYLKKLADSELYRFRIGDYRAVFKIEDDLLIVIVVKVNHRKEAYKKK